LESHFPTSASTSTASSTTSSTGTVLQRAPNNVSSAPDRDQDQSRSPVQDQFNPMMSSQENIQKYLLSSEPQYISAESVRQNKLLHNNSSTAVQNSSNQQQKRTDSPDNDSAFCDNSNSGSDSSQEKQKNQQQQQQQQQQKQLQQQRSQNGSQQGLQVKKQKDNLSLSLQKHSPEENSASQAKAEKIRLAIEKIKEASIKKIFIKVFGEDGSAKSLLVDERMSVAQVCR
jgi:transcriptional regulator of acetoin/glycerol metabolism